MGVPPSHHGFQYQSSWSSMTTGGTPDTSQEMKNITDAADASDTVLLQGGSQQCQQVFSLSQWLENSAMVLKSCYQLTAGSEILTQLCKTSKFHQKFESQNLGSQLCKRYQRSNFSQILAPETPVASAARLQLGKPSSWQGQLVRHRGIQGRTRKGPIGTAVDARQNPGWLMIIIIGFYMILLAILLVIRIHELWESHGIPFFRFHYGNFWW